LTPHREAEVHVVPYDVGWPAQFESERSLLSQVMRQYVGGPIEHIGSTAVPGLLAKPVIDVMVAVESLTASRPALTLLEKVGYSSSSYRADVMHWLCKPPPEVRTHHLHLVPFQSTLWVERIAFRDYLRAHPNAASEYADLKRQLAERFRFDREAYTDAKEPFVKQIVGFALASERRASGK
jgi:GrpB-like predicted nucleotidyltransferase (UPF0157 family)